MNTDTPPGPPRVQIQTKAGCNGRCVFCPNGAIIEAGLEQGTMSQDLFEKVIEDLAAVPPRRIGLYLMNEPLIDQRMPDLVRHTKQRIPSAKTQIITNGVYLTPEKAEALVDAGLNQLKVSLQSLDPAKNEELMGYSSERVIGNCVKTQEIIRKRRPKDLEFRVSMVVTRVNMDEIEQARAFWKGHGIRFVTSALENRGGNIAQANDLNPHAMRPLNGCIRPSRDFMVLFNGDVPLCCVDWWRTVIMGNAAKQSVSEIWRGEAFQSVRAALRGERPGVLPAICANCTESAEPDSHRRGLGARIRRLFRRR